MSLKIEKFDYIKKDIYYFDEIDATLKGDEKSADKKIKRRNL